MKTHHRIITVSLVIITVTVLYVIYTFKYRINTVLKEFVQEETNGAYQLDISKTSLSFTKGRVMLKNIHLKPSGIAGNKTNYQLKIADLYLTLNSWNQLLFHRKLYIDSLRISHPVFSIFQSQDQEKNNIPEQVHDIYASLKQISENFKVHVLEISNGDIDIHNNEKGKAPLLIRNINFRIENFGQKTKEHTKLRFSDDLVLQIPHQHWTFTSGQTISFKNLFFSGKDQLFEIDSCYLTKAPRDSGEVASLFTDKVIIKANQLASIFEKDELNIDTLYCKSPTLSFTLPRNRTPGDSAGSLNESLHQLLGNINVQLIRIENGQIQLNSSDGHRSYMSRKTNFSIHHLKISDTHLPHLQIGSIDLHLGEVSFASRDSLYVLTVKEFGLEGNDLVCRNAYLKPFSNKRGYLSQMTLPKFTLVNASLPDLLEKRLKAQAVVIEGPQVRFDARVTKKKSMEQGIPVDKFYDALDELAQLIDVHWLTIKDGDLEYHSPLSGKDGLSIKDIDAEINLDDLLGSTSPLTTKQSISALSINSLSLENNNTTIRLKNFFANGNRQMGKVGSVTVDLPSGGSLTGEQITWKNFSWDGFIKAKRIAIDSMDIGKLYFTSFSQNNSLAVPKKEITVRIDIKKLNIRESAIGMHKGDQFLLQAKANNIVLTKLTLAGGLLSWENMGGTLKDISLRKYPAQVTIRQIITSGNNESVASDIVYSDLKNLVKIPTAAFKLNYNSAGNNDLDFSYLTIYQPELILERSADSVRTIKKNTITSVIPFHIQKLEIKDGYLRYASPTGNPFSAITRFGITAGSAHTSDTHAGSILFDKVALHMDSLLVNTGKTPVLLNKLELNLSNASLSGINTREPIFYGQLNGQWNSLSLNKPTENGFIKITGLSGKIDDFPLSIPARDGKKPFEHIIDKINFTGGRLHYTNGVTVATISNITGTAKEGILELKDVEMKPEATLAFFLKTSPWQKDYLTFNCDKIVLKKINYQALLQDTALFIQQVYLYKPRLSTYRDKNMAFQHGIEKLMPTQLIAGIKMPVQIDTIYIKGATINVHEVSEITKKEGIIPLSNIDASFKNFTNRPGEKDSLIINLSGRVLHYNIRTFRYAESYCDSLSGFRMNYNISSMHLPMLTQVTEPLSAIAVTRGFADTLYARVSGNKYATFGEMNFYYHNLAVRILNKKDTRKNDLLLAFESIIANSIIIRSSNKRKANMFFVRNREKFVFNYWVKTLFSGLITSAGAKSSNKYKKAYDEVAEKYSLPR